MPRYVAFLRGVSPLNAKMPELKRCFENAGFTEVRTLLSSGNVVFNARAAAVDALALRAERAMHAELGRSFGTIVRPTQYVQDLVNADPFAEFELPPTAKRVVTFLRHTDGVNVTLPIEQEGARILKLAATEVFTAYVPHPKGPCS
jgi:uncharacterized protein (DUF1697 family)